MKIPHIEGGSFFFQHGVGLALGALLGDVDGALDGPLEGEPDGLDVGTTEGKVVGVNEGEIDGVEEGDWDGNKVGVDVFILAPGTRQLGFWSSGDCFSRSLFS